MSIATAARLIAAAGVLCLGAASSRADVFGFSYIAPQPGITPNNTGGAFHSIFATYDTGSRALTWQVNFSDRVTRGYWLVINNGPNPKTHAGELGIFYFDANAAFDANPSTNTLSLTAYGYNGENANNSWQDGNGSAAGTPAGDLIKSANDTGWIQSIFASDVLLPGGIPGRQLSFTVDATDIVNHSPMYPDMVDPWFGTGFGDTLGLWFHPARTFNVGYGADGRITSLGTSNVGYIDASNLLTTRIPAPGAAALAGLGGLLLARRRRSA